MSSYSFRSGDALGETAKRQHAGVYSLAKLKLGGAAASPELPPPPVAAPAPSLRIPAQDLKRGMTGGAVRELQIALVKLGHLPQNDMATGPGVFGPRTESAVRGFQRKHGIRSTGYYGPLTRAALAKATGQAAPAAPDRRTPPTSGSGGQNAAAGTPLWFQGDLQWGRRALARNRTANTTASAMTATAMALSKISGRPVSPGELDAHLERNRGYGGLDGLIWNTAARARGLTAAAPAFSLPTIDASLKAGRPVVVGVDYNPGSGAGGSEHWITLVRRGVDSGGRAYYDAHDPGNGKVVRLYASGGRLFSTQGGLGRYKSTGRLITFR